MSVLVGGVYELFQSDLDLGRRAVERLRAEPLPAGVAVEDLHYGGVAVAQRLQDLRPHLLLLVGAVARGRPAGAVERRRLGPVHLPAADLQAAVGDAVVGYVHLDLVVEVATGLDALPPRVVSVEVEPAVTGPGDGLSPAAADGLEAALELVRAELRRAPLLELADRLRPLVDGDRLEDSSALRALRTLLAELGRLDEDGRWGAVMAGRDRFRLALAEGASSEGMDHRDWALWWALVEEIDRVERLEAVAG